MSGGPAGGASGGLGQPAPGYIPGVDAFPNQVTENVVTNAFVWSALANTPGASNNVKALAKEAITKAEPYLQTLQQAQQPQVNPNG